MKHDQRLVQSVLIDTVTLLCRNGLGFDRQLRIQGVIGITVDETDTFIVHMNDTYHGRSVGNDSAELSDFSKKGIRDRSTDEKSSSNRSECNDCDAAAAKSLMDDVTVVKIAASSASVADDTCSCGEKNRLPYTKVICRRRSDGEDPQDAAADKAGSSSVDTSSSQSGHDLINKSVRNISIVVTPAASLKNTPNLSETRNSKRRSEEEDVCQNSVDNAKSPDDSCIVWSDEDEGVSREKSATEAGRKASISVKNSVDNKLNRVHALSMRIKAESSAVQARSREYLADETDDCLTILPRARRFSKSDGSEFASTDALPRIKSEETAGDGFESYEEGSIKMEEGPVVAWDIDESEGFSDGNGDRSTSNWAKLAEFKGSEFGVIGIIPARKFGSMPVHHSRILPTPYRLPPGRRPAHMRPVLDPPYSPRSSLPGVALSGGDGYEPVSRFVCAHPGCGASFSNKHNLQRHQTNKHGREKCYRNRQHGGVVGGGAGFRYDEMGAFVDGGSASSFGHPATLGVGDMGDDVD